MPFDAGSIESQAKLDINPFLAGLKAARKEGRDFSRERYEASLGIDRKRLTTEVAFARKQIADLSRRGGSIAFTAAGAQARTQMTALARQADQLRRPVTIPISVRGWSDARRHLELVNREARELRKPVTTRVDVATAAARSNVRALRADMAGLRDARFKVDADTAAARAGLTGVKQQSDRISGSTARINVDSGEVSRAIGLLGLLTAAAAAASAAVAPVGAGLVGIAAIGGAAAQGLTAAIAGTRGIGDALTAMTAADKAAANAANASGASRVATAARTASAARSLQQAQIAADRSAITGAQQVADSRRAVQDAVVTASARQAAAEREVFRVQRDGLMLQAQLNRARLDAADAIEDLGLSLRGVAIDERDAILDLAAAQESLQEGIDAGVDGAALERLRIGADRAQLALDQARERFGDLREENEAYNRSGIEGSEQVVAAQSAIAAQAERLADAQAELDRARSDGAADVQRAREQLARTEQQAAWSAMDAADRVADAQRQVADAARTAGAAGVAAFTELDRVMERLTPEGRRFALFLRNELQPDLKGIGDGVQAAMLPKLQTALDELRVLAPDVNAGLSGTGDVLGDLAVRGAQMMTSGPWRRDFVTIMGANNRILDDFGNTGLFALDSVRSLTIGVLPMVERFSQATEAGAEMIASWLEGKRSSGELAIWFNEMGDRLAELWVVTKQVAGGAFELTQAWAPLGMQILQTVGAVAELIGNFAAANPELVQFITVAGLGAVAVIKLGTAIGSMAGLLMSARAGYAAAGATISTFGANAAARLALATDAAGRFTTAATGSSVAGNRVAAAGARMSGAFDRAAGTLPLVGAALIGLGVANDYLSTSTDEAVDAINRSTSAAADARTQIGLQSGALREQNGVISENQGGLTGLNVAINDWIGNTTGLWATTQSLNEALAEQEATMSPLEKASRNVTMAQNDYNEAVNKFGSASVQARSAQAALSSAVDAEAGARDRAEDATKSHLDRLRELADFQRGLIDSDFAYRQSIFQAEQAQRALANAIDMSGASSFEARGAMFALEQQMLTAMDAARQQALVQFDNQTSTQAMDAANRAAAESILRMAELAGGTLPPALQTAAANLGNTQFAALGARIETDEFGNAILRLPNGKAVPITAPGAVQARDEVNDLRAAIEALPANSRLRFFLDPVINPAGTPGVQNGDADIGGILRPPPNAIGSITRIAPMARGGMRGHPAGVGTVVGPNTPTLIGDRKRDDEAYIPLNRDARSMRILEYAAMAMGRALVPMATGGITGSPQATSTGGAVDPLNSSMVEAAPLLAEFTLAVGTTAPDAVDTLTAALIPLADTTTATSTTVRDTWADTTTAVAAAAAGQEASEIALAATTAATTAQIAASLNTLRTQHTSAWAGMQTTAGNEVGVIVGTHFAGLQRGLSTVAQAYANTAGSVQASWAPIRAYTGDPIRWSLDNPINRGLVPAWGAIDRFFALGKPLPPVPIGFATGGEVPGVGNGDTVPAWLTPGEYVISKPVVQRWGLDNIHAAHLAARSGTFPGLEGMFSGETPRSFTEVRGYATGGVVADTGSGVNAAVDRTARYGRAHAGRRYLWGGTGPIGWDCSGWAGSLQHVAQGDPNVHSRIYTTSQFGPGRGVAGLVPGTTSAFTVGVQRGHMAGTLAGTNFESGGAHRTNAFGGPSAGTLDFPWHYSLPVVGGQFIPGAGGGIDIGAFVDEKLGDARRMSAQIPGMFGAGSSAAAAQALADRSIAGARDWALNNIVNAVGVGADVSGITGPVKDQVRQVAARYGWAQGPQWAAIEALVQKESSWNPAAANPSSSARGLFQKMTSIHGPVEPTAAGQATWGLNYIKGRYGDPASAWAFHRSNNYYNQGGPVIPGAVHDTGGVLAPGHAAVNLSNRPEYVVPDDQWEVLVGRDRPSASPARASEQVRGGNTVNVYPSTGHSEAQIARNVASIFEFEDRYL